MTAVAMTEQIEAGHQIGAETEKETLTKSVKGPVLVQASGTGSDIDVDEEDASKPQLKRLVSMGAVLRMDGKYERENKLLTFAAIAAFTSLAGLIFDIFKSDAVAYVVLVYYLVVIALSVAAAIMFCFHSEKQFKSYLNRMVFGEEKPSEYDTFRVDERQYVGLWLYFAMLYNSLFILFRIVWYLSGDEDVAWISLIYVYALVWRFAFCLYIYTHAF